MSMEWSYLLLAAIGVVAGFVNVLAGGGSLLTLPIMNLYMGMPGPLANGTNRFAILAGAINAVIAFFKKGRAGRLSANYTGYGPRTGPVSVSIPVPGLHAHPAV